MKKHYKCLEDGCQFETTRKWNLQKHVRNMHGKELQLVPENMVTPHKWKFCPYCGGKLAR